MLFLIICLLLGLGLCLAFQPILNHLILPQFLFMPPQAYIVPDNVQSNNETCWLQFNRPQPVKTALVFFHGNACDISQCNRLGSNLSENLNCDVFIPEYPQYNIMKNRFPHLSIHDCLPTLVRFMQDQVPRHKYNKVILVGQSLGSHFATRVAALGLGTDLCLISPFYSIQYVAKSIVGDFLASFVNVFDSSIALKKIEHRMSVLILHGTADEVIPFENAKMILDNSPSKSNLLLPLEGVGHNNIDMDYVCECIKKWSE